MAKANKKPDAAKATESPEATNVTDAPAASATPAATATPDVGAPSTGGRTNRSILAGFFWVLASLGIMVGGVTLWAHQSVLTSDGWTNIISSVASDPEVIENTSTVIVDRIAENIGLQDIVVDILPGEMELIGSAIALRVQDSIADGVANVASSDRFQEAFVNVNRLAHDAALKVIRDEGEAISVEEGTISLNVFPLIGAALEGLQEAGFIDESREIPDLTEYQPAEENVARLETLLGRELPSDIGTITLVESDRLDRVQTAVRNFDIITVIMLLIALLSIVLALWLSQARVRMVLWLAIGAIAALAVGRAFTRVIIEDITGALRDGPEGATVNAVINATVDQLMWFTFALIVVALIVAGLVMAYERREAAAESSDESISVGDWLRQNARSIGYAGLAIIGFLVLWNVGGPDIALLAGAAVGIWLVAVNLLAGRSDSGADSAAGKVASESGGG